MKAQLLLCIIFCAIFGNAQIEEKSYDNKKNIIKTNLTSIPFRNYQFTYERSIAKWFSIGATYGMMPEGEVPLLEKFVTDEDLEDIQDISAIQLQGNTITIDTRFYLGKGYGKGFYLSPYYRHSSYEVDNLTVDYPIDYEGQTYDIPLDVSGEVTSNNIGFMMGVQWTMGKRQSWVMDFTLIGAHYGKAEGDLFGKAPRALTPEEQALILGDINDYDVPVVEYEVEVNEQGAKAVLDGPWGGLRAGLSLGFRF